nr:reverse transcriptase domain-containing protein [Tanacetum cinerariifolium]
MVAILEKTEHNTHFHQIVDFLEASHIRIETTNQETKILATVDGKLQTIYESSLRRHLKLNDEDGISSLPDAELFEILSLMGYNILPKQSNIATAVVCLATNRVYNFSKMIFNGMDEGSTNPTEPHHTPSPQELHSPHYDSLPPSHQPIISEPLPQAPTKTLTHRKYTKKAIRIAQSKALSPATDELASLSRDDRQGEAFPTISSLDARQDRKNIAKTSALPHESSPRVSSLDVDEGNQDLKISRLKARIKSLKDKERRSAEPTQEDASITGGIKDIWEDLGADKSTELGSNDTKEMVNVLSSMEAANILTSEGAAASVSPADVLPAAGVLTVSESFSTISAIFTTASVVTSYTRWSRGITIGSSHPMRISIIRAKDKGKEKLARDSEIARLHAEEDLKMTIKGLDRSNEVIAKHLREYEQAKADLSVRDKLELISELVKYQDHRAKILKYQAQQSKPLSKKEQKKFYMSYEDFVPMSSKEENHRVKRQGLMIDQGISKRMKISQGAFKEEVKGMMQLVPLEEVYIEALQVKHPIIDWEIHSEGKREYWKIIRLGGHTTVYQFFVDMLKQFDREDLYQLWTLVKETFSTKQATRDKEKELWLYDTCGVHHVSTKDQEIFMLVEKDYPLRKGLATGRMETKIELTLEQSQQGGSNDILEESRESYFGAVAEEAVFTIVLSEELVLRRSFILKSHADPTLLNDFEMATKGKQDPPVPDLRTMEELCQPSLNGRGGPISSIAIQATNFGLKIDMIQQVQNSCQFLGLSGDDANKHLDKFLHVTQSIKVNGVTDDALRLYLFPYSLTHHATAWFDRLPRNSINTFEQMAKKYGL